MDSAEIIDRHDLAIEIAQQAGKIALDCFRDARSLEVEIKGRQDFVTEADRTVERYMRDGILTQFPDDSILGEEFGVRAGSSAFSWLLDPIDGTTNFIHGIPAWAVVIAGVVDDQTEIGVVHDPVHN